MYEGDEKNTALIKPNVLLLAQGQGRLQLCWGWMHLTNTAAQGWGTPGAGGAGAGAQGSEPRGHRLWHSSLARPLSAPQPWQSRAEPVPGLSATQDGMLTEGKPGYT